MIVFGEGWSFKLQRVRAAPPMLCIYCEDPIRRDSAGAIMPCIGADGFESSVAYHRVCLFVSFGLIEALPANLPCDCCGNPTRWGTCDACLDEQR